LSRVNVPAPTTTSLPSANYPKTWPGPWQSITDPQQIAHPVAAVNKKQYNQAEVTPFGSGYLADQIGLSADKPGAKPILRGTFILEDGTQLLRETKDVLSYLNTKSPFLEQPFPVTIEAKEFQATYRIVKEKTSSSSSSRHVGHYKAAASDDTPSSLHSIMMSLPYIIGFSPTCWQNIVDVMLEKDKGNPKIHHL
jgi:hypothetical protein